MKPYHRPLARAWQAELRDALSRVLRAGGEITDVVRVVGGDEPRVYYLVTPTAQRRRGGAG